MTATALVLYFVLPYGFAMLILFFVIKAAIKAALEAKTKTVLREEKDHAIHPDDVIKLRDLGILSDDELEEAAELYQEAKEREENHKTFIKYEKVLYELKQIGYLNDEQYMDKIDALKRYCDVE